jgi:polyisoprenoid-binding protein YceI
MKLVFKLSSTLLVSTFIFNYSFSQTTIKSESTDAVAHFYYISEQTKGEINNVKCSVSIDTLNIKNSKAEGVAQVDLISTSNAVRDKHLKSKTYFNLKLFPEITFSANEFVLTKSKNDSIVLVKPTDLIAPVKCKGVITLKGFKKPITFDVFFTDTQIIFKTLIYADDFGVAIKPGKENSLVELEITTERN